MKPQVTNHVTRSSSGEVQPGLGVSWSHVPRTRILLERVEPAGAAGLRSATLIKSSRQVMKSAQSPVQIIGNFSFWLHRCSAA